MQKSSSDVSASRQKRRDKERASKGTQATTLRSPGERGVDPMPIKQALEVGGRIEKIGCTSDRAEGELL